MRPTARGNRCVGNFDIVLCDVLRCNLGIVLRPVAENEVAVGSDGTDIRRLAGVIFITVVEQETDSRNLVREFIHPERLLCVRMRVGGGHLKSAGPIADIFECSTCSSPCPKERGCFRLHVNLDTCLSGEGQDAHCNKSKEFLHNCKCLKG